MKAVRFLALLVLGLAVGAEALAAVPEQSAVVTWQTELQAASRLVDNDANAALREVERLERGLPASVSPADQVRLTNLRARAEGYLGYTEAAAGHAREALAMAERARDSEGQAEAHLNNALLAIHLADLGPMRDEAVRAAELLGGANRPDLMVEALVRQGMFLIRQRKIDEGVTLCLQSMDIAQRAAQPEAFVLAHHCMAVSYGLSGNLAKETIHYQAMRDNARRADSRLQEGIALLGLANGELSEGDRAAGKRLIGDAIGMFREVGAVFALAQANVLLARSLQQQGELAGALLYAERGLEIYERRRNRLGMWWSQRQCGEILMAQGKLVAAREFAEKGLALAREIGLSDYVSQSQLRLATVYAAQGDFRQAYRAQDEAARIATATSREQVGKRIGELAERFQNDSRQRKIDELALHGERQAARQRWLGSALALSLVLLALCAYLFLYQRRTTRVERELNARLEETGDMLRALAARRESAREEERGRIARELHDELGQRLTALRLKINLQAATGVSTDAGRGELLDMVDNTIRIVRNVSSLLRPAVLDLGIAAALEWLAGEFRRNTGIPCQLDLPAGEVTLPPGQAIALFRIAQESLTNVGRYAAAGEVHITFRCEGENYILEVRDDGVGFTPDQAPRPKSFGLIGIRERALAAGGDAVVLSAPAQGTTIRVTLPVNDENQEER